MGLRERDLGSEDQVRHEQDAEADGADLCDRQPPSPAKHDHADHQLTEQSELQLEACLDGTFDRSEASGQVERHSASGDDDDPPQQR